MIKKFKVPFAECAKTTAVDKTLLIAEENADSIERIVITADKNAEAEAEVTAYFYDNNGKAEIEDFAVTPVLEQDTLKLAQSKALKYAKTEYRITIPDTCMISELNIQVSSANIRIKGFCGSVDVGTVSGDINLSECFLSGCRLESNSGTISTEQIKTACEFITKTSSGNISIEIENIEDERFKEFENDLEIEAFSEKGNICIKSRGVPVTSVQSLAGYTDINVMKRKGN